MHQCIWKGTPIIGTYGGREIILPKSGTCSKMIFLIGFKESKKMIFSVNLPEVGSFEEFTHQWESLST